MAMTHFVLRQTCLKSFFYKQKNQKANETCIYIWVQFTLLIIAPLLSITIFYTAIAVILRIQTKALAGTHPNVQRHAMRETKPLRRQSHYNNGAWYLGAVLPLCFYTHLAAFHPILEAFLCHSESTSFYDDFLAFNTYLPPSIE